jgi:hypothetical protein
MLLKYSHLLPAQFAMIILLLEDAGRKREGLDRMTVPAFCMTPPWGGSLAGSRMVNGPERDKQGQAIMAI